MSSPSQNYPSEPPPQGAQQPPDAADWKQEVNDRLRAHRTRRGRVAGAQTTLPLDLADPSAADRSQEQPVRSRARVAARVAERYAKAPTYSEVLGSEVLAQQAAVPAQAPKCLEPESQTVLAGLLAEFEKVEESDSTAQGATGSGDAAEAPDHALQVTEASELADAGASGAGDSAEDGPADNAGEWIPGNLIEFPRVLVAALRARPRLAEGPLREEATVDTDPERSQLRIFEVEQQAISTTAMVEPVATEWSSIRLDALPRESPNADAHRRHTQAGHRQAGDTQAGDTQTGYTQTGSHRREAARAPDAALIDMNLEAAPISDRLMAGVVDGALVALAFVGFVAVFVACTTHPPAGKPALIASACTLAAFFLLYQYLFFTYSGSTPGMRYARIALCTFDDENPTRGEMQRRIGCLLLSACPLALGFAWAWFDPDRLGWHDRMSRTYQRSYR